MRKLLFVLLIISSTLISCQKDAIDFGDVLEDLELKSGGDEREGSACFEIQFPLTVIMPDGSEITGNDREKLNEAIKEWYKNNKKDVKAKIQLKYPINVLFRGTTVLIENENQMKRVKYACSGERVRDGDKKACFQLAYPLTYNMPDGTSISGENKTDVENAIKRWYASNRSDKKPALQFPVNIIYPTKDKRGEGKVVEIANQEELEKAYKDCKQAIR